ncbi:acid phosphatase [Niabella soli DSM 19437]|uniref:Acid phosphatase n=2 Tax=Niabella TaxID=379899 RepID=W0F3S6_9BACT|nr:acid phosphatase [Niabella soli DSM 19437]
MPKKIMNQVKHILVFFLLLVGIAACRKRDPAGLFPAKTNPAATPTHTPTPTPTPNPTPNPGTVPTPDHVVVLIMENHSYSQVIGSSSAPYITALASAANSTSFISSYAIEHPSQPNYLDLYSGNNQGVTDDEVPAGIPFTTPNLGRQLLDSGMTFTTFSEDLPSVGYNGATSGQYARKHNPAANWMGTGKNQIPATTNQPLTAFPGDFTKLPTVAFVVPNLINDIHDGTVAQGDSWVKNNFDAYIQWAKTHNSVLILTFDEDDNNHKNQIPTIFSGQHVKTLQDATNITHYSVLRTIEEIYHLPYIGNATNATTIVDCWQ